MRDPLAHDERFTVDIAGDGVYILQVFIVVRVAVAPKYTTTTNGSYDVKCVR